MPGVPGRWNPGALVERGTHLSTFAGIMAEATVIQKRNEVGSPCVIGLAAVQRPA
jgi:hypothetical protein